MLQLQRLPSVRTLQGKLGRAMSLVHTEVTPDKIGIITLYDPDRLNALTGLLMLLLLLVGCHCVCR